MMDVSELYQEIILEHGKSPRNFGTLDSATHHAEGFNPLCGDRIDVYLKIVEDAISDVAFKGSACAICLASASMMTEAVAESTIEQAQQLATHYRTMLMSEDESEVDVTTLGSLASLQGVKKYPMRVKCATLPWHTMIAAIDQKDDRVSTE